jgi:hypothetical protein
MIIDGTLDECIRRLMLQPKSQHHLYEIHTAPQPDLVSAILSADHVVELARLEAALLLHRTKMLFEFPDEFFYPPHGVIIRRLSRQSLVSSDLSFELFPVFFSIHER